MTTTFHWVVSPRKIEDLQQTLSEDAPCLGYDYVSLGEWWPNKGSACIITTPDLRKTHSCWTLLMIEDVGWECLRKVGTHAPHNRASYRTQELFTQKQRCQNITRTEIYPQSNDNQCFQRIKSSCLTGNTCKTAPSTNTATWSLSIIFMVDSYVLNDRSPQQTFPSERQDEASSILRFTTGFYDSTLQGLRWLLLTTYWIQWKEVILKSL
jgi:hypothetical protein